MNENLIGDKTTFAIEYSILMVDPSPPYGNCIIWLEGNSLGGIEGEIYLTRVCQLLEAVILIKNKLFLEEPFYNLSHTELFNLMRKDKIDETSKYWFLYTEGFDLFDNYLYRRNDNFHFLWQLTPKVWKEFEPQGIPTQLLSAQVAIGMYEKVVNQFKNALMLSS
ncbi:hypothetical protein NIES2111_24930 [Nostoc sp. NIES-2111]|nr:hypothetical protein NIES2111_24930 [Nostoc sp. NIES-2111]